jgi:hypothetical protein
VCNSLGNRHLGHRERAVEGIGTIIHAREDVAMNIYHNE